MGSLILLLLRLDHLYLTPLPSKRAGTNTYQPVVNSTLAHLFLLTPDPCYILHMQRWPSVLCTTLPLTSQSILLIRSVPAFRITRVSRHPLINFRSIFLYRHQASRAVFPVSLFLITKNTLKIA